MKSIILHPKVEKVIKSQFSQKKLNGVPPGTPKKLSQHQSYFTCMWIKYMYQTTLSGRGNDKENI